MRQTWISKALWVCLIMGSPVFAAPLLLQDGQDLRACPGRLLFAEQGGWTFQLTQTQQVGSLALPSDLRLSLLPNATLAEMIAYQQRETEAAFQVWARVTRYCDRNYFYLTYWMPLAGGVTDPNDLRTEQTTVDGNEPVVDQVGIPQDILHRMQTHKPQAPRQNVPRSLAGQRDHVIVGRQGVLRWRDDVVYLALDGWGRNLSRPEFRLLPSQVRAQIEEIQNQNADPVHFRIVGITTVFEGQPYLLLQRAVRVYGYGNFN